MKKIYMILAAFSLLTLSLNAQMLTVDHSNRQVHNKLNGKEFKASNFSLNDMLRRIPGMSEVMPGLNPYGSNDAAGSFRAPMKVNAGEVTLGPFTGDTFSPNGIGLGSAYDLAQPVLINTILDRSEIIDYNGYDIVGFRFALASQASTNDKVRVYDFISWPEGQSGAFEAANQHTWNLGAMAGEQTVSTTMTVADGTTTNSNLPVAGLYQDYGYRSQMIYPASLLNGISQGDQITSITFYPSAGLLFSGSTLTFQLCNTTETNFGTSGSSNQTRKSFTGAVSATITPSVNNSLTQWTITFDSPLTYTGGNLLLDVYCVGYNHDGISGLCPTTNFYGANQSSYVSLYVRGAYDQTPAATKTGSNSQFLPKTTFGYTSTGSANYVELQAGQWHEFYLDEPVEFVVNDTIAALDLGYRYLQYPSTNTTENIYPIAVNTSSQTHDHWANLIVGSSTATNSNITISVPDGTQTSFYFIYVVDNETGDIITGWDSDDATQSFTSGGTTYTHYTLPTGWSMSSPYFMQETVSGYNLAWLYTNSTGTITIKRSALNGKTNVSVYIAAVGWSDGQTITVNGTAKDVTNGNLIQYAWENIFNAPSAGWQHMSSFSSSYGDLAVQLILKSKKTDAPIITGQVDPNNESNYVITATGDGTVTLTVGDQTVTGNGTASITIPRTDVDQTVTATATAQASGKEVSDPTTQTFVVPLIQTAAPVITGQVVGDNYVITATGNGNVTLNVGDQTASGQGSASITIPLTSVVQNVTATATAQETGKAVSETTTQGFTIPFLQTATPVITYTTVGESVVITATGNGSVTLTVGDQTGTAMGSVSITVPFGVEATTVTATATAWENGKAESEPATQQVPIPAGEGWLIMDGTYNNPNDLLSFKYGDEDIMMIDQFLASTFNNDHPAGYTYTLRQTIDGVQQSSSPVSIPVYKTSSTLQGLYTQSQVDGDTKLQYRANVMNTEIDYNVAPDHNTLYYNLYRSDINADYPELSVQKRRSQLQRFEEKIGENAYQYFLFETHQSGIAPKYDRIGSQIAERLDTAYIEGVAEDEIAYVPVITTVGLYSARADGLNNTYGSDIKRNWLGSVNIDFIQGTLSTNSVNGADYGIWKAPNGVDYCVYTPFMRVSGIQPPDWVAHDDDHYTFEPYMYRVWCIYPDARDFAHNANGQLIDAGELGDTILLQTVYVQDPTVNSVYFGKEQWVPADGKLPYTFGVPASVASDPSVLQFIVRFYYKRVLVADEPQEPGRFNANREGDDEQYYIVENEGDGQDITTGIAEFYSGKAIIGVTYVNPQGMTSDKPFDGVNIVITRYNDGTTSTFKQVVR